MHPNLSKFRPNSSEDSTVPLNAVQVALIAGVWIGLFVIGYTLLP